MNARSEKKRSCRVLWLAAIILGSAVAFQVASVIAGGHFAADPARSRASIAALHAPGWSQQDIPIAQSESEWKSVLRYLGYDDAIYRRLNKDGQEFELLVVYWAPGAMPVDKVAAHTPDSCWPGSGWKLRQVRFPTELRRAGFVDPGTAFRIYEKDGTEVQTMFFHKVDGRVLAYGTEVPVPLYQRMTADLSWFGHKREQYFVRLTSRRGFARIAPDAGFRVLCRDLLALGGPTS